MIRLRGLTGADLPLGLRLSRQAGWNQTPADWQRFLDLEPTGCFVAEWQGQPVATTAAFVFDTVGWIAMVLVDEAYRRRGLGTQLVRHALAYLDSRGVTTVRLDATALGRPVYEQLGFVAEYGLTRFQGTGANVEAAEPAVFPVTADAASRVAELDRQATATPRQRLLERLIAEQPSQAAVVQHASEISGYALFRPGTRATHIGPAVAITDTAGLALLNWAWNSTSGQNLFVDVPCDNRPATAWAQSHGFVEQRRFTRMCRGRVLEDRPEWIWASSGPEKG